VPCQNNKSIFLRKTNKNCKKIDETESNLCWQKEKNNKTSLSYGVRYVNIDITNLCSVFPAAAPCECKKVHVLVFFFQEAEKKIVHIKV
jgi:hypothetical protein